MAKKMKKLLAGMMSLSLCMSMFTNAVSATTSKDTTNAGDYGEVEITVTTQVLPSEPTVNPETGLTDATTRTESSWEESDKGENDPVPGVGITEDVDIIVNGKEVVDQTVSTDENGNVIVDAGTTTGEESIDIVKTTTEITEEEDVLLNTNEDGRTLNEEESEDKPASSVTTNGEWEPTGNKTEGQWETTDTTPGEWSDPATTEGDETSDEVETGEDNLAGDHKVTITLTPGNETTVKEKSAYSSAALIVEELGSEGFALDADGNLIIPEKSEKALANGGSEVITYTVQETANGYEIVKTVVTTTKGEIQEGTATDPEDGDAEETGRVAVTPALREEDAALLQGEVGENSKGEAVKVTATGALDANGEGTVVRTEIKEVYDESGKVIGYEITEVKTTVDKNTGAPEAVEDPAYAGDAVAAPEGFEAFIAPVRPAESTSDPDADGIVTTVTVTEGTDDNGNIYYIVSTVKTDSNDENKVVYTGTERVYGTYRSFSGSTQIDPEYKITTTTKETVETTTRYITAEEVTRLVEEISNRDNTQEVTQTTDTTNWELVYVGDDQYFIYEGKMYAVVDKGTLSGSNVKLNVVYDDTKAGAETNLRLKGENGYKHKGDGDFTQLGSGQNTNYTNQTFTGNRPDQWTGYGLHSSFVLKDANNTLHSAKQFTVQVDGEQQYLYCVELGADLIQYQKYSITRYGKTDGQDDGKVWNGATGTVAQVRSVAVNGYWGSDSGLGSLEAVKDLLRRNGKADLADKLTEGHAIAATQAALWEFGQSGSKTMFDGNGDYIVANTVLKDKTVTADDKAIIDGLHDLLVDLANNQNGDGVAEVIGGKHLTGAAITLKDKSADAAANSDDNADNDLFDADLSFTLAVSTSSINGDLLVHVQQNGKTVASARLAGNGNDATEEEGVLDLGKVYPNADGTYTLSGLKLNENATITLNIAGTQHVDDGVYIYNHRESDLNNAQDFIGLTKLEQNVNLSVNMEFNVVDPEATLNTTTGSSTQTKTDTFHQTKTDQREEKRIETSESTDENKEVFDSAIHKLYGTVTVTKEVVEETHLERDWETSWEVITEVENEEEEEEDEEFEEFEEDDVPLVDIPDEDVPLVDIPDEDIPLEDIPDEEVPLAAVPQTGDASVVWLIMAVLSGSGLLALAVLEKQRKQQKAV